MSDEQIKEFDENEKKVKVSKTEYLKNNWKPIGQGFLFGTVFGTIAGSIGTAIALSKDDDLDEEDEESSDEDETES